MNTRWKLEKKISLSALMQMLTIAGLILGSWLNLQRQLDLLSRDVRQLMQTQEKFCDKTDRLADISIALDYRLQTLETKK